MQTGGTWQVTVLATKAGQTVAQKQFSVAERIKLFCCLSQPGLPQCQNDRGLSGCSRIGHCKSGAGDCTKATSCCGISTNLAMPSVPSVAPIDWVRVAPRGDVQSLAGRRLQPDLHPPTTHI